ncbi:MAG: hypothetical protein V2I26_06775 [Halieaceae bacterium]|jgi:hypothetical protein|nr:hypothetical protein [Halieaceae bacterium]
MIDVYTFAAETNTSAAAVIERIKGGRIPGEFRGGRWYVTHTETPSAKEDRGNYGLLGALIGIAGSIWFWFGMSVAQYNLRDISLYEVFTDTSIQAANNMSTLPNGNGIFWSVFIISTIIVTIVFGFIGSFAKK